MRKFLAVDTTMELDPVEEVRRYVRNKWLIRVFAMMTTCYHCEKESPIIFVRDGRPIFGHPDLKRVNVSDNTEEIQFKLAEHGWKFQFNRSYCPDCKGLGSV